MKYLAIITIVLLSTFSFTSCTNDYLLENNYSDCNVFDDSISHKTGFDENSKGPFPVYIPGRKTYLLDGTILCDQNHPDETCFIIYIIIGKKESCTYRFDFNEIDTVFSVFVHKYRTTAFDNYLIFEYN